MQQPQPPTDLSSVVDQLTLDQLKEMCLSGQLNAMALQIVGTQYTITGSIPQIFLQVDPDVVLPETLPCVLRVY